MRSLAVIGLVLILAALQIPGLTAQAPPPRGHLVIVGGNGLPDAIVRKALALSGDSAAVVAVFPQASELKETGPSAVEFWIKAGAKRALEVNPADRAAAMAAVKVATFIWFPGGDQNRLTEALKDTGLPELIRERYHDGATVGGTSAGGTGMRLHVLTPGMTFDLSAR